MFSLFSVNVEATFNDAKPELNENLSVAQYLDFYLVGSSNVYLGGGGIGNAFYTLYGPSDSNYEYRWSAVGAGTCKVTPFEGNRSCHVEFKSSQSGEVRVSCDVYLNGNMVGSANYYVKIIY